MTSDYLEVQDLHVDYGSSNVLDTLSLQIPTGKITAIVGANACGKSTLLRTLSRLIKPTKGQVLLNGVSVHSIAPKQLARILGLLPQAPVAPEGITVVDLVSRGRHPHRKLFKGWGSADDAAVALALETTKTVELADRFVDELSGGQRQRVWIAMALAQQTDVLLLDEPTTYLDINNQIEVLDLLTDLNHRHGTTIIMVLHDLNLAARYADYLVALANGKVRAFGAAQDVMTQNVMMDVFQLDCQILSDPSSGKPMMVPRGRHHMRHN